MRIKLPKLIIRITTYHRQIAYLAQFHCLLPTSPKWKNLRNQASKRNRSKILVANLLRDLSIDFFFLNYIYNNKMQTILNFYYIMLQVIISNGQDDNILTQDSKYP